MSNPLYGVGDVVQYVGLSANLTGRIGIVKRVRRDDVNGTSWVYRVAFGNNVWKVHERNLSATEDAVRTAQPVPLSRLEPVMKSNPLFGGGTLSSAARPEPMPIERGSRVVLTQGVAKYLLGVKGTILGMGFNSTLGKLLVEVRLDQHFDQLGGSRAHFSASSLAPLVEQKKELPGLWKDGKRVRVTDFGKILHRKGQMHGPADGMIMAQALAKQS